jgi:hypothetical protein
MRKKTTLVCLLIFVMLQISLIAIPVSSYGPVTRTFAGGSLTTSPGAYTSAVKAYSPYGWNILEGDLTIEGTFDLGGIQARKNTWDPNTGDIDDYFGIWAQIGLSKDPVHNSGDGVWLTTVEWLGGGDDPNTQIREIFHMQEEPGTQPMPKLYTGPRTIAGGDGDDTHSFKLQLHSTGATSGWAKLWIDGVQIVGDMWSVFTPEEMTFSGEDLSCAQVLVGIMNGNNPNNPAHTFSWTDLTVTGYLCCPLPVGGEWVPVNTIQMLVQLVGSVVALSAVVASFVGFKRIKKRQN